MVPYGARIEVKEGEAVEKGTVVFQWDPYTTSILANHNGTVRYVDLQEKVTFREELDETTGLKQRVVIESRNRNLSPQLNIVDGNGNQLSNYILPTRALLQVADGQQVKAGDILAKIPREIAKTRDITGGLPRVAELFEARKPKEPAVVSEIDGVVHFGEIRRGVRKLSVTSEDGQEEKIYLIPYGKHVLVHDGDYVQAGEKLCEGSVAPEDILNIMGPNKVQEYLVNEIQEVYRLQGVRINDKHIEVIVRQMLQKVKIEDPGDTMYLEGDQVDKIRFLEENDKIRKMVVVTDPGDSKFKQDELVDREEFNKENAALKEADKKVATSRPAQPATFLPLLLGITKASLTTESFISAASFQETTRVLTDAAIEGKVDRLYGLKENVIMGHLIPAGTGLSKFKNLWLKSVEPEEAETPSDVKDEYQAAVG
ncbi:MAG: DNA-directed RNA polymerase subunit beta', partial [Calditrichaeota bacterium]